MSRFLSSGVRIIFIIAFINTTIAVDLSKCFVDFQAGAFGEKGGVDGNGRPVSNVSEAIGFTYKFCIDNCGNGSAKFKTSAFLQKFAAWLLPWLALLSQLPFGAEHMHDNFMSVLLAVGSPMLAAYSLALTALNRVRIANRFKRAKHPYSHLMVNYPNPHLRPDLLNGLQQVPLRVNTGNALLASLVVLPQNDEWWAKLNERLGLFPSTWSIPAGISIAWVVIAYILTVIDAFISLPSAPSNQGISDGQAVGTVWLWLLPIVVGWLQLSPKSKVERVCSAIEAANTIAYVATTNGVVKTHMEKGIFVGTESKGAAFPEEANGPPIFNYAHIFPWTQCVEHITEVVRVADRKAKAHITVSGRPDWAPNDEDGVINPNNRQGSVNNVVAYCVRRPVTCHWDPSVLGTILLAFLVALVLQWGISGAAIIILWFTPTVGMGCRSFLYLLHAGVSTIVWMMLFTSSVLMHHSTSVSRDGNHPPMVGWSRSAVWVRRLGKGLAVCNVAVIITAAILQFSNRLNNCSCNSSRFSLGDRAFVVISTSANQVRVPWSIGVTLASIWAFLFVLLVKFLIGKSRYT